MDFAYLLYLLTAYCYFVLVFLVLSLSWYAVGSADNGGFSFADFALARDSPYKFGLSSHLTAKFVIVLGFFFPPFLGLPYHCPWIALPLPYGF